MEKRAGQIPIYTIGYGNRSIEELINLLCLYEIQYLVDVRSQPYSRFHPDFSKAALEDKLKQRQLRYISRSDGVPSCSTGYWLTTIPLTLTSVYGREYYLINSVVH